MLKKLLALTLALVMALSLAPLALAEDTETAEVTHWAGDSIARCDELGILDGMLQPREDLDLKLPRGEMFKLMDNVMKYQSKAENVFSDLNSSYEHYDEVLRLVRADVVRGYEDGTLRAESSITRAEAVVLFARMFRIESNAPAAEEFSDAEAIGWAKPEVGGMKAAGYIQGWEGSFHPQETITLGEVTQILSNMLDSLVSEEGKATEDVDGSGFAVINKAGVTVEGAKIGGNLMIAPGVGEGDATLKNVSVGGALYILGGGKNSVIIEGSFSAAAIYIFKDGDTVRLVNSSTGKALPAVTVLDGSDAVVFSGNFGTVNLGDGVTVSLAAGTKVSAVNMNGEGAVLNVGDKAEASLVTIAGDKNTVDGGGKVTQAKVESGSGNAVNVPDTKVTVSAGAGAVKTGDTSISSGSEGTVPGKTVSTVGGGGGGGGPTGPTLSPVTITAVTTGNVIERTYTGPDFKVNLTELFSIDANAGAATYTIAGGTGSATLTGSELSAFTAAGTFTVRVNTVATSTHAAGSGQTTLTINKAPGAEVQAVSGTSEVTTNSITINAVAAPENGQTVEYAICAASGSPNPQNWQTELTFSDLEEYTNYFIYARARANALYEPGASSSFIIARTEAMPPVLIRAETNISGTKLLLIFDQEIVLPADTTGANGFTVENGIADSMAANAVTEIGFTSNVYYSKTLVLTLTAAIDCGDTITLAYDATQGDIKSMPVMSVALKSFAAGDITVQNLVDVTTFLAYETSTWSEDSGVYTGTVCFGDEQRSLSVNAAVYAEISACPGLYTIATTELGVVTALDISATQYFNETNLGKCVQVNGTTKTFVVTGTTYKVDESTIMVTLDYSGPDPVEPSVVYGTGAWLGEHTFVVADEDNVARLIYVCIFPTEQPPEGTPSPVSAAVIENGTKLIVEFDEVMAAPAPPAGNHGFAVTDTAVTSVGLYAGDAGNKTLELTLAGTVPAGSTVSVSYDMASGDIESAEGVALQSFGNRTAANRSGSSFAVYSDVEFIAVENSKGETEYTWTVVLDGEAMDLTVNAAVHTQIRAGGTGLYGIAGVNGQGVVTALDIPAPTAAFPEAMVMAGYNSESTLIAGGKTWVIASDTIFIRIFDTGTSSPKAEASEQGAIVGDASDGSTVYVEAKGVAGDDLNTARVVFIWVD